MAPILFRCGWLIVIILLPCTLYSQVLTEDELERWFEEEGIEPPYPNRGGSETLEFIPPVVDSRTPHSSTWLTMTRDSFDSGWVHINQCYDELDAVPDAQVVYRFREMRHLRLTEVLNMERAWVDGSSVQMKNIGSGARLCVELEARVIEPLNDGNYLIRYGPFERRFLDSYFPMHVEMEIEYPPSYVRFLKIAPEPTEGLSLEQREGRLELDAWFRGKLVIELHFAKSKQVP